MCRRMYSPLGCRLYDCLGCAPAGKAGEEEGDDDDTDGSTFHRATCLPFSCRIALSRSTEKQQ